MRRYRELWDCVQLQASEAAANKPPGFVNPLENQKSWDKAIEAKIAKQWESDLSLHTFDPNSKKSFFVIDTPPPYPSGRPWHVGGASHYAQIDMIARSARMRGFEVLFPVGIDRNGLPVELYAEKKYNVSIRNTPREKFLELCSMALDDLENEMVQTLKLMGFSADFTKKYRTDDKSYRALTQATFIDQWNRDRIYVGTRPSNYCVDCGTTIADAEIVYLDLPTKLAYFSFQVVDAEGRSLNSSIPIASTRPELICACQTVMVNPEDARYSHLVGKFALVPFYDRKVPIIAHSSAKSDFGTGAVMVCSYGDYTDVQLFRELSLQELLAVGQDGRMKELAGPELAGLKIKQARGKMLEILKAANNLAKTEEIAHRTPTCERSKTPIEIIPMQEFYLKVTDIKEELRKIATQLHFHPEMHRSILLNWIEVSLDWPISRRRFYGTEVPVWYCKNCGESFLPPPGAYYQPWRDPPPHDSKCKQCGSTQFQGDDRTLDTWMDSSISALYVTKYRRDDHFFSNTFPATIRPQGKDIIRTWLHYSIVRCWGITGKVPWSEVWITGWGLDEKGERMSKSKGNVIDPLQMLEKYGAESFRLWTASEVSVGSDYTCSEQKIATPGKFLTKLWNVSRFIAGFPIATTLQKEQLAPTDRWILAELSAVIKACLEGYEDFNFFIPSNRIRDFTWNTFAAHYVELAKGRAYGQGFSEAERSSALYTLHECLKCILLLLAPICPFITEAIWTQVYSSESIHRQHFPTPELEVGELALGKKLLEFNSMVWNEKKAKGLSLKDPIALEIPKELAPFAKDLRTMHNLA